MATRKGQKDNVSVADLINDGTIKNLADVDWKEVTGWDFEKARKLILAINGRELQVVAIDAIISELKSYLGAWADMDMDFRDFQMSLIGLKQHIKNYDLFDIAAIKRRKSQELTQMKQDIRKLKEKVFAIPDELNTDEARQLFGKIRWCVEDGSLYRWDGTTALFGAFVDLTSDRLNIRPSNGRIPWRIYKTAFQCSDKYISTAKQAVNDYKNNHISEPEGYKDIKDACG